MKSKAARKILSALPCFLVSVFFYDVNYYFSVFYFLNKSHTITEN